MFSDFPPGGGEKTADFKMFFCVFLFFPTKVIECGQDLDFVGWLSCCRFSGWSPSSAVLIVYFFLQYIFPPLTRRHENVPYLLKDSARCSNGDFRKMARAHARRVSFKMYAAGTDVCDFFLIFLFSVYYNILTNRRSHTTIIVSAIIIIVGIFGHVFDDLNPMARRKFNKPSEWCARSRARRVCA